MAILQILFALGSLGILGFIAFWLGVALHTGPKVTQNEVNKDPRLK